MIQLPISDFILDYYKENGYAFTDSEKATIFWNSELSRPEVMAALRKIADTTADETLKTQIQARLDEMSETERRFAGNDGRYFFLSIPDNEDEGNACFTALEAAIAYGKEHSIEKFKVEKEPLMDQWGNRHVGYDSGPQYGYAEYAKDGVLLECVCSTSHIHVTITGSMASSFEEAYIPVHNPYKPGDIVRRIGGNAPAIVVTSQEKWDNDVKRHLARASDLIPANYENTRIFLLYLDGEDGRMYDTIWHILSLEKIEEWDNELEWNLLQAAGKLVRGEGSLDNFLYYYNDYLSKKESVTRAEQNNVLEIRANDERGREKGEILY